MKEQIQNSLEIICADEEAYLKELVACRLQFESYKYDRLIGKLVEVSIIIFHKFSFVQVATVATSFRNEPIVNITKEPEHIRRGAEHAIVSYTFPMPIQPMEVHVVTINT
jgi:hypothetical protein